MNYKELADELLGIQLVMTKLHSEINNTEKVRGEHGVLIYLDNTDGTALPSQLAEFLGVTTARMAGILKTLEDKGMVNRRTDKKDRRKVIVKLTKKGKDFAQEGKVRAIDDVSEILEGLGEEDAKEYIRIMNKMVTNLEEKEMKKND